MNSSNLKDKTMFVLAVDVMIAIILTVIRDIAVAVIETQVTGEEVNVSAEVMTLVQTALGGVIGILGGYFGAKGMKKTTEG